MWKCNFTFDSKLDFENQGLQHNIPVKDDLELTFGDEEEDDTFKDFENLDDHQSNYIQCDKCEIFYHNEFELKTHEKCEY